MHTHHSCWLLTAVAVVIVVLSGPNSTRAQDASNARRFDTTVNIGRLGYLTQEERDKLAANGFVICIHPTDISNQEASQVYLQCQRSRFPIFVSSDAMLHTWHLVADWSLRFLEASSLRQDLVNLTDAMLTQSLTDDDDIGDDQPALKAAAMKNAVFFNVAKCLLTDATLDGVPENIREKIEAELALIDAHDGFATSPLFGYREDYSQYAPRGHYTRTEDFKGYFKAMVWYGRMGFHLNGVREVDGQLTVDAPDETGQTLQALLICRALAAAKVKGEAALDVWNRIYETSCFFAGRSDDLSVRDYATVMEKVYGADPSLEDLRDGRKLAEFLAQARKLPKPAILSTLVTDVSSRQVDWRTQTQQFRLMGQRFTPDAHIFQNLVYDKVTAYRGGDTKPFTATAAGGTCFRGWPRGLDVMAVFGSDIAAEILAAEGDTDYEGYDAQFGKLRAIRAGATGEESTGDLYGSRLWALRAILSAPGPEVPPFMRSRAWRAKQVNAALGSWTELKHDTIVYTKQPYAMAQAAMAGKAGDAQWRRYLPAEVVRGYVEPVPELYARIRQCVAQLREKYVSLGFPADRGLVGNFQSFEGLLASLETIANKELAGRELTDQEYELIEHIGSRLTGILMYSHYIDVHERFASEVDNKMAIVADVFTQVNEQRVLEEAVGLPAEIFVIAPVDGRDKVCRGVAYSYYEFKQPMEDRLTDEKWREMLEKGEPPPMAPWSLEFTVLGEK